MRLLLCNTPRELGFYCTVCVGLCTCKYMGLGQVESPSEIGKRQINSCTTTAATAHQTARRCKAPKCFATPVNPSKVPSTVHRLQLTWTQSPLASRSSRDPSSSQRAAMACVWPRTGIVPSLKKQVGDFCCVVPVTFGPRGWPVSINGTDPARLGADFSIARRMRSPADGTYDVSDSHPLSALQLFATRPGRTRR